MRGVPAHPAQPAQPSIRKFKDIFVFGALLSVVIAAPLMLSGCAGFASSNSNTGDPPSAPTITTQPANQTVTAGQTAAFSVVATGTAPLSYQWQENDANIAGATSASYTTSATTTSESGSTFTVVVSNSAGSATSASATLTITSGAVAPTISTQPASQTVTAGQTATFSVVAAGTAPLSYHWQKNGANITGATATSYTTPATASSDSGSTFDVVVSNTAGTITSAAAALIVNAAAVAPTITTQPTNQTVTAGQTATFSVVAAGSAPLSYQWQKNGANITGATATSYTTPATASSDSGSTFDVVVSNTAGTITSAAATLTVNAAVQHSVALTWDASTSTVVGYNVYRGTASGGPYTQINPSLVAALDYTDSTVQDSTTYYYVTTAVDSGGNESIYSNEAPAVVP